VDDIVDETAVDEIAIAKLAVAKLAKFDQTSYKTGQLSLLTPISYFPIPKPVCQYIIDEGGRRRKVEGGSSVKGR